MFLTVYLSIENCVDLNFFYILRAKKHHSFFWELTRFSPQRIRNISNEMIKSPFHDSILSRLARNELTIESFLQDRSAIIEVRRQNKIVTSFLLDYIDSLLKYAIDNSNELSQNAMKLIETRNPKIICAICDEDEINKLAAELIEKFKSQNNFMPNIKNINANDKNINVINTYDKNINVINAYDKNINVINAYDKNISNNDVNNNINIDNEHFRKADYEMRSSIGRFATILEICIKKYPDCINNFDLNQFLPLCENTSLFSLFESIIEANIDETRKYFKCVNIINSIIELLENWHQHDTDDHFEFGISDFCAINLYHLLYLFAKKGVYEEMNSPKVLKFFLNYFHDSNESNSEIYHLILSKKWKILIEMIDATNVNDFSSLLEISLQHSEIQSNKYEEYQVDAMNFISSILNLMPSLTSSIDISALINNYTEVFRKFSNSSIVLSGLGTFLSCALEISDLHRQIYEIFLPAIINEFKNDEENANIRAFTLDFGRRIILACDRDEELKEMFYANDDFRDYLIPMIEKANLIMKSNDSFKVAKVVCCDTFETLNPSSVNMNVSV
ncbi:hypothetical protein TRFO_08012 [Tritrichomonas foetus]|uniref:Uncharacterized protein n=1 Tax=Tritrichomonas foetus TaxID=1144522 RepID=A0A1J4JST9_9EUKA|nr:hypothetical protein TRFO_08012 [Tritrichomonas foetus]|eukprot:OHT00341.1 hypothetical protein TRFO_08012 [Tritrichomonas foetus]